MKRVATEEHEAIVRIPLVESSAIVVVEPPIIVIVVDAPQLQVAVRVGIHAKRLPCHRPSNALRAASYPASQMP
jgi:hypothetical protein